MVEDGRTSARGGSGLPSRRLCVAGWALFALAGCGGGADPGPLPPEPPTARPLPLPASSASRWARLERDDDGDGLAEAVTTYRYDDLGRLIELAHQAAAAGVPQAPVLLLRRWTYDDLSRIVTDTTSGTTERRVDAAYGADGLLASTRSTFASAPEVLTQYTWQDQRMVRVSEGALEHLLSHDDVGRVTRIETRRDPGDEPDVQRFVWRSDGRLDSASYGLAVGNLVITSLLRDEAGRLQGSTIVDDGFEVAMSRHSHDGSGRLVQVDWDDWPASLDEADFVADRHYRIVWEDGLCQPVHLLGMPPSFDRDVTGLARADGATLQCAD